MTTQDQNLDGTPSDGRWFQTTHWSVVLRAGGADSCEATAALGKLCQAYWYPLYTFVRRSGHGPEEAKDLTQEFFARLLAKNYLQGIEPDKGKFRSFLLVALKRFLANEWDKANRLKRGGGREFISLDAQETENRYSSEPADMESPEKLFERRWAMTLLEQVMAALHAEFSAAGKGQLFGELKPYLSGDDGQTSYAEISERLGISEGALRVNVHRLRQRYRELLRLEISHTVASPEAIDEEIRYLFSALS